LLTIVSAPVAPEVGELENHTVWDTPLTAAGRAVPERVLEDETMVAEKLVEEGVEEADHEARLRASEEMNDEEPQE